MKFKTVGYTILILIGMVVILSVSSHLYVSYQKQVAAQKLASAYQQTHFTPDELKEDLNFFQYLLEKVHPKPIATFPLGNIKAEMKALDSSIEQPMTRLEFYRRFAPVVSLLNDDHTMVPMPEYELTQHYKSGGKLFPFQVQFVDDKLYIAQNLSDESQIKVGMEIVAVNGISANELRTKLMLYYFGTRDAQKLFFLQQHFREALFLGYGLTDRFELVLRDFETKSVTNYTVSGKPFARTKLRAFYYEVIDGNSILFTYNAFEDEENSFESFLKEMFSVAKEQNIEHLIIDLRHNQGGATALGDKLLAYLMDKPFQQFFVSKVLVTKEAKADFLSNAPGFIRWFPVQYFHPWLKPLWLTKEGEMASVSFEPFMPHENELRFQGNLYLIISPMVMSSGSLFAATVQTHKAGVLIGEKSGGFPTAYGNVLKFHLPNTGLKIKIPCGINYGNGTEPIVPDYTVTQTVPDLIEHKDTVLELTKSLFHN